MAIDLGFNLGVQPARPGAPFRLIVVGSFGGSVVSGVTVSGEVPATLPGQFGARIACEVEDVLGGGGAPLAVEMPVNRFSDLTARSLMRSVDVLARAGSFRATLAAGRHGGTDYPGLERLVGCVAPTRAPSPRPAATEAEEVDRLLSLLGGDKPAPPPAASLKNGVAAVDALIAEQLGLLRAHPRFAAVEGTWRGVQLLLRRAGSVDGLRVDLVDAAGEDPAVCLARNIVPDEREETGAPVGCIVVAGAVGADPVGRNSLELCAAAGAELGVPVLASLRPDFLAEPGGAAILAELRGRPGAEWLAACLGDVVLDAQDRAEPCWGEPGWAVAVLLVESLAATGQPGALADPAVATLSGLDTHELPGRGGPAGWPLRHVPAGQVPGVTTLDAQRDRDRVFLTAARTVGGIELGAQLRRVRDRG